MAGESVSLFCIWDSSPVLQCGMNFTSKRELFFRIYSGIYDSNSSCITPNKSISFPMLDTDLIGMSALHLVNGPWSVARARGMARRSSF